MEAMNIYLQVNHYKHCKLVAIGHLSQRQIASHSTYLRKWEMEQLAVLTVGPVRLTSLDLMDRWEVVEQRRMDRH